MSATFEPSDPDFEAKVRASFVRQRVMETIGARLTRVTPGHCEIELPFRADLSQQHGYLHAGITALIADSAGGYAAFSLMPARSSILSVEFKVNLLAPAIGELFVAHGRVVKPGRRITVCELEVRALRGAEEITCLCGLQTTMCLPETPDRPAF